MEKFIEQWLKAFDEQVSSIEIEFNAYFGTGKIRDYFAVEFDHLGKPMLHFYEILELPHHIHNEIVDALHRTMPKELNQ